MTDSHDISRAQNTPNTPNASNTSEPPTRSYRWQVLSFVVGCIIVGILPAATWILSGPADAARAVTDLVMPIGVLWVGSFIWAIGALRSKRSIAWIPWVVWLAISLCFSSPVARWAMTYIECPLPAPALTTNAPYRSVIVLGGGTGLDHNGQPRLNGEGQRVLSAAQLWHTGSTQSIICTGTSVLDPMDPSEAGSRILQSVGVPATVIYEVAGENTLLEMQNLKRFLDDLPDSFPPVNETSKVANRVGIITSAFHMPRALRLAKDHGLEFEPLPCCFRSNSPRRFSPRDLIPRAGSGGVIALVIKERLAKLVGR